MKTGIEQITIERQEQIEKHGFTVDNDVEFNNRYELTKAAGSLTMEPMTNLVIAFGIPSGWNQERWLKMCQKPYKERLAIAGAWLAAEIDRVQYLES